MWLLCRRPLLSIEVYSAAEHLNHLELSSQFELDGGFPPIPAEVDILKFDEAFWIGRALENRSDIKALRFQLQSAISLTSQWSLELKW